MKPRGKGDHSKSKLASCRCGKLTKGLSSYFGIPLHFDGSDYEVCPAWVAGKSQPQ